MHYKVMALALVAGLVSCTTIIPSGYDKCIDFSSLPEGSNPTGTDVKGFILGKLDGSDAMITSKGSSKGLEFGSYPFVSFAISHAGQQAQGFKKVWIRPTYFGSEKQVVVLWSAHGGTPLEIIDIPTGLPDGTVRPIEYTAPAGQSIAIVGFGGKPSIANAVCLDDEVVSARTAISAKSLSGRLKLR